jgi:hypothetical protein
MLEKERAKTAQRERDAETKSASQVLGKIMPMIESLQQLTSKESFGMVASILRNPIVDGLEELRTLQQQCESVLSDGRGRIGHDVKTVTVLLGSLRRSHGLCSQVLATMSKAR